MRNLYFLVIVFVLLDQISKFYLESSINFGAAFGILQGFKWLFILVGFFVLGFCYHYKNKVKGYGLYGLLLLFSGTLGNLIDRTFLGYARDFINVGFFPSFNLADVYNTIGVLLLFIYFIRE